MNKMKLFYASLLLLGLSIPSCKSSQSEPAGPPQEFTAVADDGDVADPQEVAQMDSLLQAWVDEEKLNCVTAFVAKGGEVLYHKAFGFRDTARQVPAQPDDYYVLFSQTKAVTTVAFMTLVEKGLVAVDDPVADYFPEISDQVVTKVNEDGTYETRPVASPMTFAHLMSHSSGLGAGLVREIRQRERQQQAEGSGESAAGGQRSFGGDGKARYLEDEMKKLASYPLGFDPGSEWNYHVSTNMLAYMIEVISGQSLQEYVKETVLDPLGMDETDWYYEPEALDRFVVPHTLVDGKLMPGSTNFSEGAVSSDQTYAEGAIGLNGPIEDYAKFCQMLLNEGEFNGNRILQPETIATMTDENQLPDENAGGKGFAFGLGFELQNERKKHVPAVSNTAFSWGGMMGTEYIIDPENDVIALFYINMWEREPLYHPFLAQAYALAGK